MSTRKKFYLAKSNQEGGTIENDFKEFSKYLMELIGATTDEELKNFVKEQGPEKVNEIYKQWKEQVPMAKDGMQFANKFAVEAQKALIPGVVAIQNKIQDTAQDDLRGISSFKEAFAEARRRGLKQFSWGKGSYTTELRRADPPPPPPKDAAEDTAEVKGGEDTNREVSDSLKRRDTPTPAQTVSNRKTTPTSVPTPLQPKDDGSSDATQSLGVRTIIGPGIVGAAGAGALYYGAKKYADYSYKADKLRAARAASTSPSAPKPSIFRNLGTNAKEYLSKVPFKEKVNEYTSRASNLFKRTPAPVSPAAPAPAPAPAP